MSVRGAAALLLMGCLVGCGYSQSYRQTGPALPPKPDDCDPKRVMPGESVSEPFEVIGTFSLGDTGFSTRCDSTQMFMTNRLKACAVGADAIQYLTIDQPSVISTCFRSKVNFIRFKR
jgi:hypothetical protein